MTKPVGRIEYCLGQELYGSNLIQYWNQNDCPTAISNFYWSGLNNNTEFNEVNYGVLNEAMVNFFTRYYNAYGVMPTADENFPYTDELHALCNNPRFPGICDLALKRSCTSSSSERFCGCYFDNNPCSGNCHKSSTIQRIDIGSCANTVCVINDTNITIGNSNTTLNITQICPSCSTNNPCECIIDSTNLADIFTKTGISGQINSFCGSNSKCYSIVDGDRIEVPCSSIATETPSLEFTFSWYLVVLLVFIGIILVVCIWALDQDVFTSTGKVHRTRTR